jgi:hypothetical protein
MTAVAQLFNTILQELPVGAVLVLDVGDKEPFISRIIEGAPKTGERIIEHLLDGQQRLTALWRALHNNYSDRTYFVYFEADEETGMPYYVDSIARWSKDGDTTARPFWANVPKELWKKRMIRLDLFEPAIDAQKRFGVWKKAAIEDESERDLVSDQVSEIRQKLAGFNLPFLSLPVGTEPKTALDVFIKMNTSAAPLSTYDIVVAQVETEKEKSLHDMVAEARAECPAVVSYYRPEDLALYASALLQGRAPTDATYLDKGFGPQVLGNWDLFRNGVSRTVDFLEQERIFDSARLPTDVVVPVLVALWALTPKGLDAEGRARTILRKYLWRSFFSNRYEKSTNSRALVDFTELRHFITDAGAPEPAMFDEQQYPLPQEEELIASGWPVRRDRLARGILALALRQGGLDLADGGGVTCGNLAKREYHHLFPVAHLTRLGFSDKEAFLSLNCALVTWRTNRTISGKEPERYLAERREGAEQLDGSNLAEAEITARLASHLIPYKEMVAGDYKGFLKTRASMVHSAMTKLCGGGS